MASSHRATTGAASRRPRHALPPSGGSRAGTAARPATPRPADPGGRAPGRRPLRPAGRPAGPRPPARHRSVARRRPARCPPPAPGRAGPRSPRLARARRHRRDEGLDLRQPRAGDRAGRVVDEVQQPAPLSRSRPPRSARTARPTAGRGGCAATGVRASAPRPASAASTGTRSPSTSWKKGLSGLVSSSGWLLKASLATRKPSTTRSGSSAGPWRSSSWSAVAVPAPGTPRLSTSTSGPRRASSCRPKPASRGTWAAWTKESPRTRTRFTPGRRGPQSRSTKPSALTCTTVAYSSVRTGWSPGVVKAPRLGSPCTASGAGEATRTPSSAASSAPPRPQPRPTRQEPSGPRGDPATRAQTGASWASGLSISSLRRLMAPFARRLSSCLLSSCRSCRAMNLGRK